VLSGLERLVDVLADMHPDALQLAECEGELSRLEVLVRRLQARQTLLVGTVADRARRAALERRADGDEHGKDLAQRRAGRHTTEQLASTLNWSHTQARQAAQAAGQVRRYSQLGEAFASGKISSRHMSLAADVLRHFEGEAARELEAELVVAASDIDPVEFSKLCRRRLIERRYDVAVRDERLRHSRRSVRMTTGADGMLHLSARLAGIDAEKVAAAVKAFRRPDTSDVAVQDRRAPEQVTADALVEVCDVALSAGKSPKRHAVRPHIVVTIDWQTVLAGHGTAAVDELGVLPFTQIRRLLADAGVSRILVDPDQVPLEAGRQVRTVPTGLWRALKLRDSGCITPGCTIPAEWCQVAHLDQPYRLGGQLSPLNAALLCNQHHNLYDLSGWQITWNGNRPELHPPNRGGPADHVASADRTDSMDNALPTYPDAVPVNNAIAARLDAASADPNLAVEDRPADNHRQLDLYSAEMLGRKAPDRVHETRGSYTHTGSPRAYCRGSPDHRSRGSPGVHLHAGSNLPAITRFRAGVHHPAGVRRRAALRRPDGLRDPADVGQPAGVTSRADVGQPAGVTNRADVGQPAGVTNRADVGQPAGVTSRADVGQPAGARGAMR
jgi:hypothetical protein